MTEMTHIYATDHRHWAAVVGQNVRHLRTERFWTQRDLVRELRARGWPITQQLLSGLERAKNYGSDKHRHYATVTVDRLALLADVFDVNWVDLMTETQVQSKTSEGTEEQDGRWKSD